MFTGIVEETGHVVQVVSGSTSGELRIGAAKVLEGTRIGDSIAVTVSALRLQGCLRTASRQM